MHVDIWAIAAYAFGLLMLYAIARILIAPVRLILKLIYNGIIGGILLVILNMLGAFFGIHIAVNPLTALIAGFLGVPGIILLLFIKYFF
ncbi:pro-sigmaK processing inhibitor BofA family protein [Thermovenabulum gondwanense]|uniref:Sigma-K factor-processing regulatory protein BofA n=1 Tax=Thermovenabulum gondwanense TaxID=520767 RepID=A0A162MHU3_9FIRM|nr:pro-sigmaK processing inhibitor BofA family protein [Thermovenabulum gondwanense]KYO66100.1 Sigma-K factor-processing regulatory protein BofA [Thermovenabulum gondwanense]